MLHIIRTLLLLLVALPIYSQNKVYVVEREREKVAIIDKDKTVTEVENLGNLNHATIKFKDGFAYILSRDGNLSKFNDKQLIKKVSIGKSGIGFTFIGNYVVVANYEPYSLVFLDKNLNRVKTIPTDSRNVGIKASKNLLFVSLMDKNEIWIIDIKENFKIIKKIKDIGKLPFDALIDKDKYIVAFFDGTVGLLNTKNFKFKHILLKTGKEVVLKIPHLGTWCSLNNLTYLPAVGKRKLHVFKDFNFVKDIDIIGLPVFSTVSPDKTHIAVNYSGDKENYITIINTKTDEKKDLKIAERVMHLRFSLDGKKLYVSSFYENKLKIIETTNWTVINTVDVPTPSGIFIKK